MSSKNKLNQTRRAFIKTAIQTSLALGSFALIPNLLAQNTNPKLIHKTIPKTGETIPAIGMGTWITFNVGNNPRQRDERTEVLAKFFEMGGGMIDSSPMYGSAEEVVGHGLKRLQPQSSKLFSATKVWTPFEWLGSEQIKNSKQYWGLNEFDLLQVHNLLNWEVHLPMLKKLKAEGQVRYIGITTSHGRRHSDMEKIIQTEPIDFVQLTYNIMDREVERRLLPAAAERGIAVIANRPFQGGSLFPRYDNKPLPNWAGDIGCENWAQFFLQFVISHPAITCAIPATSKVNHMVQNMNTLKTELVDSATRQKMLNYIQSV